MSNGPVETNNQASFEARIGEHGIPAGLLAVSVPLNPAAMIPFCTIAVDSLPAVMTLTQTVGAYFGEWKESAFVGGDPVSFVAQSPFRETALADETPPARGVLDRGHHRHDLRPLS